MARVRARRRITVAIAAAGLTGLAVLGGSAASADNDTQGHVEYCYYTYGHVHTTNYAFTQSDSLICGGYALMSQHKYYVTGTYTSWTTPVWGRESVWLVNSYPAGTGPLSFIKAYGSARGS